MCGLDIGGIQEYLIPRVKYWGWRPSLVVVLCHVLLCLPNCGLGLFDCCFHAFCELVYYFQSRKTLPRFKAHMKSPSNVEQELSLLSRSIYIVVVLEFYYWQQIILVILLLIDKEIQVLVKFLVDMLYLSVGLWVLGYKGNQLNLQQIVELSYKQGYKLRSAVQDYILRQSIEFLYLVQEQPYYSFYSHHCVYQNKVSSLRHRVYYCHNNIISRGLRKLYHKVNTESIPFGIWYQNRVELFD